jgi:hypothetical protein
MSINKRAALVEAYQFLHWILTLKKKCGEPVTKIEQHIAKIENEIIEQNRKARGESEKCTYTR